jgi:ABC-type lipoprotein release transport system permease subunit
MILVGIESTKSLTDSEKKDYSESFRVMGGGSFSDLATAHVENPLILPAEKAKALNVKKGDTVRVRFQNIYGQQQSARLTVVGVLENDNVFMSGVMFIELKNLKALLGYRPWESGAIQLRLKDPQKDAAAIADKIHNALVPGDAYIYGDISAGGKSIKGTVIPFLGNDDVNKKLMNSGLKLLSGRRDDCLGKKGVIVSDLLAKKLSLFPGKKIEIHYAAKFADTPVSFTADVTGIFKSDKTTGQDVIYMQETVFYNAYNDNLPDFKAVQGKFFYPAKTVPYYAALGKEWVILERSHSTDDLQKKMREITRKKVRASTVDVNSMYESASDVLKLESALNIITLVAVLVLFFIILVGVVNTLRMTIRERTREIGTIRAIGMQKKDVRRIFILETSFLTLFAALSGTVLSFAVMGFLSLIPFHLSDNPLGILLVNQHLHFLPTFSGVAGHILLIVVIAGATSFFPARRAAAMSAADALRHYE